MVLVWPLGVSCRHKCVNGDVRKNRDRGVDLEASLNRGQTGKRIKTKLKMNNFNCNELRKNKRVFDVCVDDGVLYGVPDVTVL